VASSLLLSGLRKGIPLWDVEGHFLNLRYFMEALQATQPVVLVESVHSGNSADHRSRIKHSLEKADKYCRRSHSKHQAEMDLIERAMTFVGRADHGGAAPVSVLDAPCGVGRATIFLARQGYETTGADLGEGAVKVAREQLELTATEATIHKADLLDLPYANHCFDATLCFRFFHHLPTPAHRQEIIAELCRVTHKYLLISYLSPWSFTSLKRKLRRRLTGKISLQHSTSLSEIEGYFARQGFVLARDLAQTPFVHSLHLAVFVRKLK